MNELEQLEYKLHLMIMFKERFYQKHLAYRIFNDIGGFFAKFADKRAMRYAERKAKEHIEVNGCPETNPFSDVFEHLYQLCYTPEGGVTEIPKEDVIYRIVKDPIDFYNVIRWKTQENVICQHVHEDMYDLIKDKYGIDHSGGAADQIREYIMSAQTA